MSAKLARRRERLSRTAAGCNTLTMARQRSATREPSVHHDALDASQRERRAEIEWYLGPDAFVCPDVLRVPPTATQVVPSIVPQNGRRAAWRNTWPWLCRWRRYGLSIVAIGFSAFVLTQLDIDLRLSLAGVSEVIGMIGGLSAVASGIVNLMSYLEKRRRRSSGQ